MILERFEDAVALLLALYRAACIVAMELAGSGWVADRAKVLFVTHHLFDTGKQGILISAYELEPPLCRIFDFGFFLSFIV